MRLIISGSMSQISIERDDFAAYLTGNGHKNANQILDFLFEGENNIELHIIFRKLIADSKFLSQEVDFIVKHAEEIIIPNSERAIEMFKNLKYSLADIMPYERAVSDMFNKVLAQIKSSGMIIKEE